MEIDLLVEHGTVVPVDPARRVIPDGTVGEPRSGADWREMADHLPFRCATEEWLADGLLTALERLICGSGTRCCSGSSRRSPPSARS